MIMKFIQSFFLIIAIFLFSCNAPGSTKVFDTITLGGPDVHGDLYQKRYETPGEFAPHYNKWPGVELYSNKDIELLLESNPRCEAIRLSYWDHDTLNNFELTPAIGEFTNLKYLEIYCNRITKYPKSIEKLTDLEEIVLQIGNKKEIEFDFKPFTKLKHLTIHFADELRTFPTSIFSLKNLESLKLFRFFQVSNNTLTGLENLTNLQELYIWDSDLILPDASYNFPRLTSLILDRYRTSLPNSIYSLQTIKRFAFSSVGDTLDLKRLSSLRNLEVLYLYYNDVLLNQLDLPALKHLYISNFGGTSLNIGIEQLPSLESLNIGGCGELITLDKISNSTLRSIAINSNDNLKKVKFNTQRLQKLEEVIMKNNGKLKNAPDKINEVMVQKE